MKKLAQDSSIPKLTLKGRVINGIAPEINVGDSITPTLKEIDIRSAADLKAVYQFIRGKEDALIGFVDLNDIMTAMEMSYKPSKLGGGAIAQFIGRLGFYEKLFMRFSVGFLWRNFLDTWYQLMTEQYYKRGLGQMLQNTFKSPFQIIRYMGQTHDIYTLYKNLNDDRLTNLVDINMRFVRFSTTLEHNVYTKETLDFAKEDVGVLYDYIKTYVEIAKSLDSETTNRRIEQRLKNAQTIQDSLGHVKDFIDHIKDGDERKLELLKLPAQLGQIKRATTFLLNMKFSEYFIMYENMDRNNQTHTYYIRNIKTKYKNKSSQEYRDFRDALFEVSAFMNTNAFQDEYQTEIFKDLHTFVNKEKAKEVEDILDFDYETISEQIKRQKLNLIKDMLGYATFSKAYNSLNARIEITGRIAGFLYDRYMNNVSYDRSVNNSLKRFFNYGMRNPTELKMMADIPYLSFPIRSIDNWIDRLTNPRFIVLMSDIIDGVYGQYQDEDGQYSTFEKFQIQQGWIPVTNTFGMRLGNGAFDIQQLISNPSALFVDRGRPLLRAINTLVQTKDVSEATKQLAVAGVLTRVSNTISAIVPNARETLQNTPVLQNFVSKKPASIGTATNALYDYKNFESKYTPNRYKRPNNGRYAKYESIYRDWFNKYGQMRKPKVDPYSLVKDIQWKQYVRWRHSQRMK